MAKERVIWTEGMTVKTFHLERVYENFTLLDEWLNVEASISDDIKDKLEYRRNILIKNVNGWNEETLKMKFIAFILDLVEYDSDEYQGIFDAEIVGEIDNHDVKVIADYMIAKVTLDIFEKPYFYFHEYKQKKNARDPIGQILIAMLFAQQQNKNQKPIYGCVVYGQTWYFLILKDKNYSISKGFDATDRMDIQRIYLILKKFKHILYNELIDKE